MELLFMERKRIMDSSFYKYVDTMKNLHREEESADIADRKRDVGRRSLFANIWGALKGGGRREGARGSLSCRNKPVDMSEQEKKDLLEKGCGGCGQKRVLAYLNSFQSYGYKNEPVIDICTREVFSSPNLYFTDGIYEWDLFEVYDYAKYNRELNRHFISYLDGKENQEFSDIVYGWALEPARGWPGMGQIGRSVMVDGDGLLVYTEYCRGVKREEKEWQLPAHVFSQLRNMIDSYSRCIDFLDRCTTLPGEQVNTYIFNGTKIDIGNIRRHSMESLPAGGAEQEREKLARMQQENMILEIFEKACAILEQASPHTNIFKNKRLSKNYAKIGGNVVE